MSASKLTAAHVYIIGGVVAVILGAGLFFLLIKPVSDEIAAQEATKGQKLTTLQNNPGQALTTAKADVEKAKAEEVVAKAKWRSFMVAQSPPAQYAIPTGSREERLRKMAGWWQLSPFIRRETERFARGMPGVRVLTNFAVPQANPDPMAVPQSMVVYDLGDMSATGSFSRVMAWARRWNQYRFMNAVDNLAVRLVGANGRVQATAHLTLFIYPMIEPAASAAPAAGAPGGAPGGATGFGPAAGANANPDAGGVVAPGSSAAP
jgi:hypothetical protein